MILTHVLNEFLLAVKISLADLASMGAFGFGGGGGMLLFEMDLHVVTRFEREKARRTPN